MYKKIVLWTLILGVAAMIFCFSEQPAETSAKLSHSVTQKVLNSLPVVRNMPTVQKNQVTKTFHNFIRKLAHFGLYFCLGLLVIALCMTYKIPAYQAFFVTLFACALCAAGDEAHQMFISGRSAELLDIFIDSSGSTAGMMFCLSGRAMIQKRNKD